MFKNPFQVAIVFAVITLIVKLVIFSLDMQHGAAENLIRYFLMFMLLISVFFGIRSNKVMYEGATTFGQDFKAGARAASFYAILMVLITYVYYAKIDVDFFKIKQTELYESYPAKIANALQEKTMPIEEIKNKVKADVINSKYIYTPYIQATTTMFGLVFLGLLHSLLFAFLMKKYPDFKR